MTAHFDASLFAFLRELEANNDRDWFNANKARYVQSIQEPALAFIFDFAPRLARISPHFTADARVVGGSLFRIQRDTRFSPDKTPYKTNTGVHFRHERAGDVHAPGFYLHLERSACFAGVGIWRPRAPLANLIRQAIVDHPDAWQTATRTVSFTAAWSLHSDEMLQRVPRGLHPSESLADDIRMKSFTAEHRLTQKSVVSPGFIDEYEALCRDAMPFMAFLCDALGVPF
jgi:uncharacterized protein (TIGR02453 family)